MLDINNDLKESMTDAFKTVLNKVFKTTHQKERLAKYIGLDSPGDKKNDVLQAACAECWNIFLDSENNNILSLVISESLDKYDDGLFSLENVAENICNKVANILASKVADKVRNPGYSAIRQAISRKFENTLRIRGKQGIFYSPQKLPKNSQYSTNIKYKDDFYSSLPINNPNLQKIKTIEGCKRLVWNEEAVAQEAIYFWKAYIKEYYNNIPGYVSVYDFYCWLTKYLDLTGTGQVAVDNIDELSKNDDTDDYKENQEERVAISEMYAVAKDFVAGLKDEEVAICAFHLNDEMSMEEVAKILGYSGPSGISRYKKNLLQRLSETASQCDDPHSAKYFVHAVFFLCKKFYEATNG